MRLILSLILIIPLIASAETVWVLGSYGDSDNATAEQQRLASVLGLPVTTARAASSTRVIVPTRLVTRDQLRTLNIDAWAINLPDEVAERSAPAPSEPPLVSEPVEESLVNKVASEVPESQPSPGPGQAALITTEPAQASGDSEALAARHAEDRAASSEPALSAQAESTRLERERSRLAALCSNVSREQEKRICRAWRVGGDLDKIAEKYQ